MTTLYHSDLINLECRTKVRSNPLATYCFSGQTSVTQTGRIGLTQEDVSELNALASVL